MSRSTDHGARWSRPVRVAAAPAGEDQWWPAVAAGPGGELWVAWQQGERVLLARSTDGGRRFARARPRRRARLAQWRPAVAATAPGSAVLAWVDERARFATEPSLPQAGILAATVRDGQVGAPQRLDGPTTRAAGRHDGPRMGAVARRARRPRARHLDRLRVLRLGRLAAAGRTTAAPPGRAEQAVNDTPPALEALDDRPQAALLADGRPLVAWTDWRTDPGTARSARAASTTPSSGAPASRTSRSTGRATPTARRSRPPSRALPDGGAVVAWQDHTAGPGDVHAARVGADGRPGRALRVDDSGRAGSNQWRPAIAVTSRRVVVAWEDERDGPTQIYASRAAPSRLP